VLGDFNLHHPCWGGENNPRHDGQADTLLLLMDEHQMELLLPPGSKTFDDRGGVATIDLAFGTPWVQDRLVFCGVREDLDHQSDHLPIVTTIMTEVEMVKPPEQWQWQRTDAKILDMEMDKGLPPLTSLDSEEEIDRRVRDLVAAISGAIEASTPKTRPSDRSLSGFTQERKEAQKTAQRLRRKYQRTRNQDDWEAYRQTRNHKGSLIRKTGRDAHRARVREATTTPHGLWRLARWARKRHAGYSFTPPLEKADGTLEHDHEAKARMFRDAFFPPPPRGRFLRHGKLHISRTYNSAADHAHGGRQDNQKHVAEEGSGKGRYTCSHPTEDTPTTQTTPGSTVQCMLRPPILPQTLPAINHGGDTEAGEEGPHQGEGVQTHSTAEYTRQRIGGDNRTEDGLRC